MVQRSSFPNLIGISGMKQNVKKVRRFIAVTAALWQCCSPPTCVSCGSSGGDGHARGWRGGGTHRTDDAESLVAAELTREVGGTAGKEEEHRDQRCGQCER